MSAIRIQITLDPHVAVILRRRAAERQLPESNYVTELIEEDARRSEEALAAEGYRLLSGDAAGFAEASLTLANETWPEWDEERDHAKPASQAG